MNNLMLTVVSLSVSGSILIAILLLLKPVIKTKLSHRWQYYIWLVVVARLLIPLSFDINLMESLTSRMFTNTRTNEAIMNQNEINFPYMSSTIENNALTATDENIGIMGNEGELNTEMFTFTFNASNLYNQTNEANANITPVASSINNGILSNILTNLWILWLAIGAILLVRKITIYQDFVRYVISGATRVDDINVIEKLGNIMESQNIKSHVQLYTNGLISSPLLIGFFHPKIILPTLNINESDLNNTLLHELTHYKRGDMFYKWLVQFVSCVHWFNPLVHLMSREINKSCEFSCDEAVVRTLNENEIRSYGDTLINALKYGAGYDDNSVTSMNLGNSCKQIKERLDMIMKCKRTSTFSRVLTFMVTMFFIMSATVIGVYAVNNNTYQEQEEFYSYDESGYYESYETELESEVEPVAELNIGEFIITNNLVLTIPYIPIGEMVRIGEIIVDEGYHAIVTIESLRVGHLGVGTRPVPWAEAGGTNWNIYRGSINVLKQSVTINANSSGHLYAGAHQYPGYRYPHDDFGTVIVRIEFHSVQDSLHIVVNPTPQPTPTPFPNSQSNLNPQESSNVLDNIHQVIPFLSQEVRDELFLYAFETDHHRLRHMVAFVSPALLEQAIIYILENTGELDNTVASMAPFVRAGFLDELMRDYIVVRGNFVDMRRILPFMSKTTIEQVVIEMVHRGEANLNLSHIAPFVSTAFLDELVLSTINR